MVIGRGFAWTHIPKTGGDLTASVFRLFPEVVVSAHETTDELKHKPFELELPFEPPLPDRRIFLLNIRRLPSWILSYFNYRAAWGIAATYINPMPLDPPDQMARLRMPDELLLGHTQQGALTIDRWFRMESLTDDLLAFLAEITTVTRQRRAQVAALGLVNAVDYDHNVHHWFTDEQIRTMYETNPVWASTEHAVYGDLLAHGRASRLARRARTRAIA